MISLQLLFLVIALVCFFLAAIGVASDKLNIQATGLFFLTLFLGSDLLK